MIEKPVKGSLRGRTPDSGMGGGEGGNTENLVMAKPVSHSPLSESTLSNNFILCHGHLVLVPGEKQIQIWLRAHVLYRAYVRCSLRHQQPGLRLLPTSRLAELTSQL